MIIVLIKNYLIYQINGNCKQEVVKIYFLIFNKKKENFKQNQEEID